MPLPLPIEALLRRARNAKSPKARHDVAYFAWEASIRLAVAANPPEDCTALVLPSIGDWVRALRVDDDRVDQPELVQAYSLFEKAGRGRNARPQGFEVPRLFESLPAYRNAAVGHGSVRAPEFYGPAAETLRAALAILWDRDTFWPAGSRLVHIESVELDPDGQHRARVFDLMGSAATILDPRGVTGIAGDLLPRRMFLQLGGRYRPLHPWIVFHDEDLQERVLFFNGRRKSPRYLDYVGGEEVRGKSLLEAFPKIDVDVERALGPAPAVSDVGADEHQRFTGYELLAKLGAGGMGIVHLARQVGLDRLVAIKTLPDELSQDAVAVARFRREVRALSRCEHPNVIKILASGVSDREHYYAMEYVQGANLAEVARAMTTKPDFSDAVSTASEAVRRRRADPIDASPPTAPDKARVESTTPRPDSLTQLCELFRDAARGLEHLHERGIVHRDVKPGNLMITEADHRIVIMDLGLVAVGDASQSITRDRHQILGTLRYMPPEQLQRSLLQLDRRADIYSLGATFYELLTHAPFFDGDSEARLIEQVLRQEPVPPRKVKPSLPHDIATIVEKATRKDARIRYETAEALANDLDAFLAQRPIAARPPSLGYVLRLAIARHLAISVFAGVAIVTAMVAAGLYWAERENTLAREHALRLEAESSQHAAENERARADAAARRARDAARMALARELADDDPTAALSVLRDVENGSQLPGWRQAVVDMLYRPVALAVHEGHGGPVFMVSFSPDGSRVVSTSDDNTARIWPANGIGDPVILPHAESALGAKFSPDGETVATTCEDEAVRIWPSRGGAPEVLRGHELPPAELDFSPDGNRLVTGSYDKTARVWTLDGSREPVVLKGHEQTIWWVRFSPDGEHVVTTSWDKTVRVWRADGTAAPLVLRGHGEPVWTAEFSPDGKRVVSASNDGTARVWPLAPRGRPTILRGHEGVWHAVFSPDGQRVVTTSPDRTARIWNADGSGEAAILEGHDGAIHRVAVSPDGERVATASRDGTVRVWRMLGGLLELVLRGHGAKLVTVAYDRDSKRIASAGADGAVRVWDVTASRLPRLVARHEKDRHTVDVTPDGETLVALDVRGAKVYELSTGREVGQFDVAGARMVSVAIHPDGDRLAIGTHEGEIFIIRVRDGRRLAELVGHLGGVQTLAFRSDGRRLASGSNDQSVRVWTLGSNEEPVVLHGCTDTVWAVAFSPDGGRIATGCDNSVVRVLDARGSGSPVDLLGHTSRVDAVAFSPDGSLLVTGSGDESARIWRADGQGNATVLEGHDAPVVSVAFSPDGTRALTGAGNGDARVWNLDGTGIALSGHTASVSGVRWMPDGRVLTSSDDGTVRSWPLIDDQLEAVMWSATTYCLPVEKRQALLGVDAELAAERLGRCLELAR